MFPLLSYRSDFFSLQLVCNRRRYVRLGFTFALKQICLAYFLPCPASLRFYEHKRKVVSRLRHAIYELLCSVFNFVRYRPLNRWM